MTEQTYVPPVSDFAGDGLSEEAERVLFDVQDADLPGSGFTEQPTITPDHTAAAPKRTPRVGTLRERFARGKGRQRDATANSPRTSRPAAPSRQRARKPKSVIPNRRGQFVKPLTQFYTALGIVWTSRDGVCGPSVVSSAEACARSIDDLAYQNEWVREVLWNLTRTGMLTKVVAAHSPILFAVGMHHSTKFRSAIDNTGMGEFIANMLAEQAVAIRDALAKEEANDDGTADAT